MLMKSQLVACRRLACGRAVVILASSALTLLILLRGPAWAETSEQTAEQVPPAPLPTRMSFPGDFPGSFLLYETVDDVENATVLKRYANRRAAQAAGAGQALPEGSVLIVANHTAEPDPATSKPRRDAGGRLVAGAVRSYSGMELRAGWGMAVPQALRNGDWHYASFGADRTGVAAMNQSPCLACHRPVAQDSYVFTLKTLREAAACLNRSGAERKRR
jgi:Cytochrome P460